MPRVWLGRCKDPHVGCCLEEHHVGACNDGNMSEQEYEVECITAEKLVRKKRLYRVKWKGWPEDDSTWQSEASLVDATECLEEWKGHMRQQKLDKLWASLPEEELRQFVLDAYMEKFLKIATSYELARAAVLGHAWLTAVRRERERRTPTWRLGPYVLCTCSNWCTCEAGGKLDVSEAEYDDGEDEDGNDLVVPAMVVRQRALAEACKRGDIECVQQQIAMQVPVDFYYSCDTPLKLAVGRGHASCVRALLQAGASLLDDVDDGRTLYVQALQGASRSYGLGSTAATLSSIKARHDTNPDYPKWEGSLEVVKALTEFGVPRWGPSFDKGGDGELWAAEYCGNLHDEIREFLVATRKFNPRAGDPEVYIRLQAEENVTLLAKGSDDQLTAIRGLNFLWTWCEDYFCDDKTFCDIGFKAVCGLLPSLRTAAQSNSVKENVLEEVLELINNLEFELNEIETERG